MNRSEDMITVICEETGLVTTCSRGALKVMDSVSKLPIEDQRRFMKMLRAMARGRFRPSSAHTKAWNLGEWQAGVDSLP